MATFILDHQVFIYVDNCRPVAAAAAAAAAGVREALRLRCPAPPDRCTETPQTLLIAPPTSSHLHLHHPHKPTRTGKGEAGGEAGGGAGAQKCIKIR